MTEDPRTGRSARGIAQALQQAVPSASRRLVTCVFCDLAESTALGERADPELLRELMLGYYAEMQGVVERHGGRLEKFIGDAVAAVWGVPTTQEDDAHRAVRAAVEMGEVAEYLRPHFEDGVPAVRSDREPARGVDPLLPGRSRRRRRLR